MTKNNFQQRIWKIALPITIQCLFQASLSLIDQIMIGHLGSISIAGVGLGSKFVSLFSVTISAIVTGAGIIIAQYKGKNDSKGINQSFFFNLYIALFITLIFSLFSILIPNNIMRLYANETATVNAAATYLKIMALGFIPMTLTLMFSVLLRNCNYAKIPMYASLASVLLNTLLNYLFIYGIGIFPKLNLAGAALATSISRIIEFIIVFVLYLKIRKKSNIKLDIILKFDILFARKVLVILAPILTCEFLWSLGENVYASIYGHIGNAACAAMALTYPLQALVIGALSGVSNASGILIGNSLGKNKYDTAYDESKKFINITIVSATIIGILIAIFGQFYVKLFNVSGYVSSTTVYILYAYSLVFIAKVVNMVLGGGILRSGGKTKYIMYLDTIGTWIFGVPIGIITSKVFNLPIYYVYFFLSLEEYVRMILGILVFRSKKWMHNITQSSLHNQTN